MASIIERIDLDCASNLMRVLIKLTAAFIVESRRKHELEAAMYDAFQSVFPDLKPILK